MAEKTGILKLDILSEAYKKEGEEVIYSLEERKIGKWIDGKPLYEITLVKDGTATGDVVIPFDISDKEMAFIVGGFAKDFNSPTSAPVGFTYNTNGNNTYFISATIGRDGVHFFIYGYTYDEFVITIRYTKIAD